MIIAHRNGMVVEKSILPPDARWVEYLESTGTQWIDTGLRATPTSKIFIDFVGKAGGNYAVCGACNGYAYNLGEIAIFWNSTHFDFVYPTARNLSLYDLVGSYSQGTRYTITYKSQQAIINEQTFRTSTWSNEYVADRTFFIGAVNRGTANNYPGKGLYYGFKMWDGDVLVRDLRPIAIGNTGYMLDLLTGEYLQYGNKGTGNFIIGPDISAPAIGGGGNLLEDYLKLIQIDFFEEDDVTFYYKEVG